MGTACSAVFSHYSCGEGGRTTKFSWIHLNTAELSWRTRNLWIESFIRISRRTVVSFLSPREDQPLSSWQSGLLIYPSQTSSHPFSPPGREGAWRTSCTICPLTHRVSSAQLTTELGTTSRGHSSHGEGPFKIHWSKTCQTLYVTSTTILTRNSSSAYMSS